MKALVFLFCCVILVNQGFSQTFQWAKNVEGKNTWGSKIVCDASNNIYTTGVIQNMTNSPVDMDFGPGVYNLTGGIGNNNGYIARYNSNGDFIWAKLIFSQNFDNNIREIALDENKNVYVLGKFKGTIDFDPGPGTFFMTNNNNNPVPYEQLFIEKLDSNGNFLWAKRIGDSIANTLNPSFCATSQGELFIIDGFLGTIDFDPGAGVYNMTANGDNTYILKLTTDGEFVWARQLTGSVNHGRKIVVDDLNHLYLAGNFYSGTLDADPNPGISNITGSSMENFYIIKLDSSSNLHWAKSVSALTYTSGLYITDIHYDVFNNVYYTGNFTDTVDFDPGPATNLQISNGSADAFVSKLDAGGNHIWTQTYGNAGYDQVRQMITDSNGNLLIFGNHNGTVDFDPSPNAIYNLTGNGTYITKLDSMGNFIHVLSFGNPNGPGNIGGNAIGTDPDENILLTGHFSGTQDFNPGAGVYNLTSPATPGNYMFICKLSMCGQFSNVSYTYCDSVNLWGFIHDSSKQFVQMFSDINGCDSNLNIDLTIKHSTTDTLHQTECETFSINNVTYSSAGIHTQIYTNAVGCDSLFVIDLTLQNTGNINVTQNLDTLIVLPMGYTYQWLDCNSNLPIPGATGAEFVPSVTGSYKAVVYFAIECSDTSACKTIAVGIEEIAQQKIVVTPNPSSGLFEIYGNRDSGMMKLRVFDVLGRNQAVSLTQNGKGQVLNLSHLSEGVYFLSLTRY